MIKPSGSQFHLQQSPKMQSPHQQPQSSGVRQTSLSLVSSSDKISLRDVARERVDVISEKMQHLPEDFLEKLKYELCVILEGSGGSMQREEFLFLQNLVQTRSDLIDKTLTRAHKVQLEILVAIKSGIQAFLHPSVSLSQAYLSEVFLNKRCRNIVCGSTLPADLCNCEPCAMKSGFCNLCMCVICNKFDFEVNTCGLIGCDLCSHWTHTDCAIRNGLIGTGPGANSSSALLDMIFRCRACNRTSELLGCIKDMFQHWDREALIIMLDFVSRIFRGSEDPRGQKLFRNCEAFIDRLKGGLAERIPPKLFLMILHARHDFSHHQESPQVLPPRQQRQSGVMQTSLSPDARGSPDLQNHGSNFDHVHESPSESVSSHETWPTTDAVLAKKQKKEKEGENVFADNSLVRHISNLDKISLRDVARERLDLVSDRMQHLPDEFLGKLKNELWVILEESGGFMHSEEFLFLQNLVQSRSDLTDKTLTRAHRVQLEILVAIKSGIRAFLQPSVSLSQASLSEVFLYKRCRNIACGSPLPAEDCNCEPCAIKSGFCNLCMCVICNKFDFEANTCRWIGCDLCAHWTHTDCAILNGFIGTNPDPKNGSAPSDMIFWCRACCHNSELLSRVKNTFQHFAPSWDKEALFRELDFVRRIFREIKDPRGRKLFWKCEALIDKIKAGMVETTAREHILMMLAEGMYHTCETDDPMIGVESYIQDSFMEDTSVAFTEDTSVAYTRYTHNLSAPSIESKVYVNIEANYEGHCINFSLPTSAGILELNLQVSQRLNIGVRTFLIQYLDDENDWILITCDDDLRHYLSTATSSADNSLRMSIELK